LLKHVLRTKWAFDGYVTSDTGAVEDIYAEHKYVATAEAAVGVALGQGMTDIDSGKVYSENLLKALANGDTNRADVDKALYNTLKLRFRLGLFDPLDNQAYWKVGKTEGLCTRTMVCCLSTHPLPLRFL
jgi:beta-glucosidase-like glycosyl hydrolase